MTGIEPVTYPVFQTGALPTELHYHLNIRSPRKDRTFISGFKVQHNHRYTIGQ